MRKLPKKLLTVLTAAVMTASVFAFPACSSFTPLTGDYSGEVASNGGFVVEKGNYYYFINGVETYTSDNTYGAPVKGALMRIAKNDLKNKQNSAEIVIPSLMVASDYTSGIYIFGDRVYYATPTSTKNLSGSVENSYLDFKSAKLDGSEIESYFNVSSNSTIYRYVEVEDTVYLLYVENSNLHSYNTTNGTDTVLAASMSSYLLSSEDKTDPYVYYTMGVTVDIDVTDGSLDRNYNQVYRVRADATEAPYEYTYSEEYLEENDGEEPYTNLGEIVLDGIGALYEDSPTQFTHHLTNGVTPSSYAGYTYTLLTYTNGGIYFTRSDLATTGSVGETGWLYYLSADKLGTDWNSISANDSAKGAFEVVAQDTTYANESAIFYIEENAHHYLYIDGSNMYRADVKSDGTGIAETTLVARGVSGATLISIDGESDNTYDYVYYANTGTTGLTVNRAVYNGEGDAYSNLIVNEYYQPVEVLDVEHASSWYNYEIVDNILFYADTEAFGSTSYNYIACVDLNNKNGALMNNVELSEFNDKYADIVGNDDKDGYIAEIGADHSTLATALQYYFYMGYDQLFYRNNKDYTLDNGYLTYAESLFKTHIDDAVEEGKKETYLYSEEEQEIFKHYAEGSGDSEAFVDESGVSYRTRSYFVTRIGLMTDDDVEAYEAYWDGVLQSYTVTEEDETLPAWAWVLIGVGIGIVIIAVGLIVFLVIRSKKRRDIDEEEELMYVDTTDDEDVDVYAEQDGEDDNVIAFPGTEDAENDALPEETENVDGTDEDPEE